MTIRSGVGGDSMNIKITKEILQQGFWSLLRVWLCNWKILLIKSHNLSPWTLLKEQMEPDCATAKSSLFWIGEK